MRTSRSLWRRRALLAAGALGVVAWVKGAPHLVSLATPELQFEDLPGLAPFRRLTETGAATAGGSIFAGLGENKPVDEERARLIRSVRNDPCKALFGAPQTGSVPVAMFSDFACPVCRVMNERLQKLADSNPGSFHIVRHELPILGVASIAASRAVLAADLQGGYTAMHEKLIRTPAVTDKAYIAAIAGDIGLDQDRLLADMDSATIDDRLRLSRAIADVFGFVGTPAFAVGRTVFLGSLSESSFERLVSEEVGNPCQAT